MNPNHYSQLNVPSHKFDFLDTMCEFRELKLGIDFVLVTEDTRYDCHKLVVAASSPFFRRLLFEDPVEDLQEFDARHMQNRAIELFLQYCYQAKLIVGEETDMEVSNIEYSSFFS